MKNTVSPKITKGLQISMEDTEAEAGVVICRIDQGYPLSQKVKAMGLS
ncbi:MAG: hypothetical protein PSV36_20545 [Algoriphagus sp.]|nr:hypothetical protein [Algoriphagus sp.]